MLPILSARNEARPSEHDLITSLEDAKHIVPAKAHFVWKKLSDDLKVNKELILLALNHSHKLPPKGEFERLFPQSLRFDRDIVLAFAKRPDFVELYKERHLYVPNCLNSDKEIMMIYCSKIHRSLQDCDPSLCDDEDVVHAALSLDGLELQYASLRLQQAKKTVVAACLKDGRALEFCPPGPLRHQLVANREFMMQVLRQQGGAMYRIVAEPLKNDRELVVTALQHGLHLRFVPFGFLSDRSFILEVVYLNPSLYLEMNRATQSEPDIAKRTITAPNSPAEVISKVFAVVPGLLEDRECVKELMTKGSIDEIRQLILNRQCPFLEDKEMVSILIRRHARLYFELPRSMQVDPELAVLATQEDTAYEIIRSVNRTVQVEHPEITAKAILVCESSLITRIRSEIPAPLWQAREVIKAWIQRDQRIPPPSEAVVADDRDIALTIAQYSWHQFDKVGTSLRSDLEFMREAVSRCGLVLRYVEPASVRSNDMNLICRALSNNPDALYGTDISKEAIVSYVTGKLNLHQTFVDEFLRGIAISTPHISPSMRSPLNLLDRGTETSEAFKKLVAAFLDIPVGEELRLIRTAWSNLQLPRQKPEVDPRSRINRHDPIEGFVARRRRFREARAGHHRARAQQRIRPANNNAGAQIAALDQEAEVLVLGGPAPMDEDEERFFGLQWMDDEEDAAVFMDIGFDDPFEL